MQAHRHDFPLYAPSKIMPCPDEFEDFFGSLPNDYVMDDLNMAYSQPSFDPELLMHTIPLTLPTMSSSGYVPSPALSTTSLYVNASITLPQQYTCQPLPSSMIFSNSFPSPPNPPSDHERILSPCTMYDAVDSPPSPASDASGGMPDIPLYAETASDPKKLGIAGAPPPRGRSKKTFPCTVCGRRFTRNYNLREHMQVHDSVRVRRFHCTECPRSYFRSADLSRHRKSQHTPPILLCICGAAFRRTSQARKHQSECVRALVARDQSDLPN
ncbi:uncharacterized protein SPPG_09063 [Spizellomyces punctatus DAOM BR117]|uniref:C2H2-type domain-containing protein n=1 Tax=Spizellomyces punctatus (strain DAOM BR117) TaxID=645134 RepID=A0A0L0HNJ7_SPIPD|nr:uncharacterized protein SPPG_09063 [Spizellomyces punctatus DAOM BR117]KND02394.1 hypothetical protein SPPG_09063 [Spizellomyces punctatus DAOM BR117]|eukprot:XP_016610433.1 hypothetical protein SPPG_09063 [Spizellomyces punctatus DAOM BR117]